MRDFVKNLSAGGRFSAIVILLGFFSVMIPAAIEYAHANGTAHNVSISQR